MERKYPNLSKPIKIGNVTFRNRMFSAPMGEQILQLTVQLDQHLQLFMN
jgi:NADH:flavin oxidoreductases, Old Yellow Enzyme family